MITIIRVFEFRIKWQLLFLIINIRIIFYLVLLKYKRIFFLYE